MMKLNKLFDIKQEVYESYNGDEGISVDTKSERG